jgi:hypothetical protein
MDGSFEPGDHRLRGREVILAWLLAIMIWVVALVAMSLFLCPKKSASPVNWFTAWPDAIP